MSQPLLFQPITLRGVASWPKQDGWWLERREPGLRKLEGAPLPFRKM
ncbi:hypothetical protein JQ633_06485 [Bradyrhizobium tropiciagri]|nr:hypothetical protein [Bradyrhizobium tropiciagri]MBR0869997.1 hypothetical protein [Bradyrhizobium tropiciagri]